MNTLLRTPIGRLRLTGMAEGTSFLLLTLIAMPLKHLAGRPEAVFAIGWVHGLLFIALCAAILLAVLQARLPMKLAVLAFVASLIPFGPFLIDSVLKRADSAQNAGAVGG